MILTKERAEALHADKVFLKVNAKPPTDDAYGAVKIGHDFKVKGLVRIEERTGLYKFPYTPCTGGEAFCGLCSMGIMSYSWSALPEPMKIGRYCSIASGLVILDSHHPLNAVTTSLISFRRSNNLCNDLITDEHVKAVGWHVRDHKPWPTIGHDVWIGRGVTIAMGVKIGTGAVIAAGSVVTKDIEPYTIVGGNPAKPIRRRFDDETVAALLGLEWWNYSPADIVRIGLHDPVAFASALAAEVRDGAVKPYQPTAYIIGKGNKFERVPSHLIQQPFVGSDLDQSLAPVLRADGAHVADCDARACCD